MALFGALRAKNAGDRVDYVEQALDGSNPTDATFNLADGESIKAVYVSLKNGSAPGVGTSVLTYDVSDETVSVYAWKPTSSGDATLIASTGTETHSVIAIIGR